MLAKLTALSLTLQQLVGQLMKLVERFAPEKNEKVVADAPVAEAFTAEPAPAPVKVAKVKKAKKRTCLGWLVLWPLYLTQDFLGLCMTIVIALFDGSVAFGVWAFERIGWLLYGMFLLLVVVPVVVLAGLVFLGVFTMNPLVVAIAAFIIFAFAPFVAGLIWVPVHFRKIAKKARMSSETKAMNAEKKKQEIMSWFWLSLLGTILFFAVPVLNVVCGVILVYTSLYAINEWRKESKHARKDTEVAA